MRSGRGRAGVVVADAAKLVILAALVLAIPAALVLIGVAKGDAASASECPSRSAPKLDELERVGDEALEDVDTSGPFRTDYCEFGSSYPVVGYGVDRWANVAEARKHFQALGWVIAPRKWELPDYPTAVSPDGEYLAPIQGPDRDRRHGGWHTYVQIVHSSTPPPPEDMYVD